MSVHITRPTLALRWLLTDKGARLQSGRQDINTGELFWEEIPASVNGEPVVVTFTALTVKYEKDNK